MSLLDDLLKPVADLWNASPLKDVGVMLGQAFGGLLGDHGAHPSEQSPCEPHDPEVAKARLELAEGVADGGPVAYAPPVVNADQPVLPPEKQAAAIEAMNDKEFAAYMRNIPAGDSKEQLAVIAKMKANPERRLQVWAAMHNAEVEKDLDADLVGRGSSIEDLDFITRRENENSHTHAEVKEEQAHLKTKFAGLDPSKPADAALMNKEIDDLVARKEKEHEIERKYNVDLTNDAGERPDGRKIVWTVDELDKMDGALELMPKQFKHDGQLLMNDRMRTTEFHRAVKDAGGDNAMNHANGVIDIYDNATRDSGVVGDRQEDRFKREKADPDFIRRHGDTVSLLECVINHEMGHSIQYENPEQLKQYEDHGLTGENFAQDMNHAVNVPEMLYRDQMEQPAKTLAADEAKLARETDPARREALEKKIADGKTEVEQGKVRYDVTRNQIMHTDVEQANQERRLQGLGLSKDDMEAFQARAKLCMTPEQLGRLADKFAGDDPDRLKEATTDPRLDPLAHPAPKPSADEQAKALGTMSDAEFQTYLKNVPAGDAKEQLAVLAAMKDHPERKLAVWAAAHDSEVERDLDADAVGKIPHGDVSDAGKEWLKRRETTAGATHAEVKEEKAFLEEKLKHVNVKDPAAMAKLNGEIDELMARKEKEHEIERRYNVNLTNDTGDKGVRNDAGHTKVAWTLDQLDHVDAALEHVSKNKSPADREMHDDMKIFEFHRGIANAKGDNAENFHNGLINVYDNSMNGGPSHPPTKRELEDPDFIRRHGEFDSFQEQVLTHEMGHSAHDQTPGVLDDYQAILARGRPNGAKAEYLAEDFKNAQIHPVEFAKDCFVKPRENLKRDEALLAHETDPTRRAALEKQIADDRYTIDAWPQMYASLRTKVFHGDAAEADAAARLEAMHSIPPEEIAEFRRQAQYLATPDAIERLAGKYAFQEPDRHKVVEIPEPAKDPALQPAPATP